VICRVSAARSVAFVRTALGSGEVAACVRIWRLVSGAFS
jgi:hypothetical protein